MWQNSGIRGRWIGSQSLLNRLLTHLIQGEQSDPQSPRISTTLAPPSPPSSVLEVQLAQFPNWIRHANCSLLLSPFLQVFLSPKKMVVMEVALNVSLHPADVTQLMNRQSQVVFLNWGKRGQVEEMLSKGKRKVRRRQEKSHPQRGKLVISQLCLRVFHTLTSWVENGGSLRKWLPKNHQIMALSTVETIGGPPSFSSAFCWEGGRGLPKNRTSKGTTVGGEYCVTVLLLSPLRDRAVWQHAFIWNVYWRWKEK